MMDLLPCVRAHYRKLDQQVFTKRRSISVEASSTNYFRRRSRRLHSFPYTWAGNAI